MHVARVGGLYPEELDVACAPVVLEECYPGQRDLIRRRERRRDLCHRLIPPPVQAACNNRTSYSHAYCVDELAERRCAGVQSMHQLSAQSAIVPLFAET